MSPRRPALLPPAIRLAAIRLTAILLLAALLAAACGGSSDDVGLDAVEATTTSTTTAPTTTTTTAPTTTEAPLPEIDVRIVGDEEVVFDYSESACGTVARPDLPARAFRLDDTVSVVLSHEVNHRMIGPDFDTLTVDCAPILSSAFDIDPAAHAHHEWLAATHVEGSTVHAVIHNEFHGYASELADSRREILDFGDPVAWDFFARRGDGSTTAMSPAESGFTAGGLCSFDFWGGHPDLGCDAVARWNSDRDGELVLDLFANKAGVGGDGVVVDVQVDGTTAWEVTLTDADPRQTTSVTVPVRIGSTIDLGVNAIADSSFDATELRMVITPDGERCTADDPLSCTVVELTAARSDDGGATFQRTATPNDLVASPGRRYVHDGDFSARWQPSNIVAHPDGSHVMLLQLDEVDDNSQYTCLLRTTDLADPTAWRAWDGDDFTLPAIDAYTTDEEAPRCERVGPAPISGLVWHRGLELFVASGGFAQFGTNGHYLLFSPDLFRWSDPVLVKPADFVFTSDTPPFEPYGTLIDHGSDSPSFDTIGDTPHLYFTRINDPVTLDFDLVRIPLEFSVAR